jgi:hypothetical protein
VKKLPRNLLLSAGTVLVLLLGVALVGKLASGFRRFSAPATGAAAIQYLGPRDVVDTTGPTRSWGAFSISNGTSKPFFYYAAGIDYRSPTGWVSATWTGIPGPPLVALDYQTSSGIVAPSNSTTFFAGIPTSNIPWRLRLWYREAGLRGSLETSFYKLGSHLQVSPPSTVWSGKPQLLITDEIKP